MSQSDPRKNEGVYEQMAAAIILCLQYLQVKVEVEKWHRDNYTYGNTQFDIIICNPNEDSWGQGTEIDNSFPFSCLSNQSPLNIQLELSELECAHRESIVTNKINAAMNERLRTCAFQLSLNMTSEELAQNLSDELGECPQDLHNILIKGRSFQVTYGDTFMSALTNSVCLWDVLPNNTIDAIIAYAKGEGPMPEYALAIRILQS